MASTEVENDAERIAKERKALIENAVQEVLNGRPAGHVVPARDVDFACKMIDMLADLVREMREAQRIL